jgi:hypothetical protein
VVGPLAHFLQTAAPALSDAANAFLLGIGHYFAPVERSQYYTRSLRCHAGAHFGGGSAEVRQLLTKRLPKIKLRDALLSELLPKRRQQWAELLAWSAFAKKHQPDCAAWEEMVVVARELLGDRPLGDIPLITIADRTLAVHRQRNA